MHVFCCQSEYVYLQLKGYFVRRESVNLSCMLMCISEKLINMCVKDSVCLRLCMCIALHICASMNKHLHEVYMFRVMAELCEDTVTGTQGHKKSPATSRSRECCLPLRHGAISPISHPSLPGYTLPSGMIHPEGIQEGEKQDPGPRQFSMSQILASSHTKALNSLT